MTQRTKKYVVKGNPVAFMGRRKFNDGVIEDRTLWELLLQQQHGDEPIFNGPIKMSISFFFRKVAAGSKVTKGDLHSTFPNMDNLCHFIFEILQDIVIKDARIVCSLKSTKEYAKNPYTEIVIEEVIDEKT